VGIRSRRPVRAFPCSGDIVRVAGKWYAPKPSIMQLQLRSTPPIYSCYSSRSSENAAATAQLLASMKPTALVWTATRSTRCCKKGVLLRAMSAPGQPLHLASPLPLAKAVSLARVGSRGGGSRSYKTSP
jgi:hypothetical protein